MVTSVIKSYTPSQNRQSPFFQPKLTVNAPNDAYEQEADSVADQVMRMPLSTPQYQGNQTIFLSNQRPCTDSIQRYESPEHQDLGDKHLKDLSSFLDTMEGKEWTAKNKLNNSTLSKDISEDSLFKGGKVRVKLADGFKELTYGEIIALSGDLFSSSDSFQKATTKEVENLLVVMSEERNHTISAEDANKKYEALTKERKYDDSYLELAKKNNTHFAKNNQIEWENYHGKAIDMAKKAKNEEELNQALFLDAFGNHFLTDSFAAGHLIDYDFVKHNIEIYLSKNDPPTKNPEMKTYISIMRASNNLKDLVLKNIHDYLNANGADVENDAGMKWKTFGDKSLSKSPETQRIGALAVFKSRQQIFDAYHKKDVRIEEVKKYLPSARSIDTVTKIAIDYIPKAAEGVESLIYNNRGMSPLVFGKIAGTLVEANLDAINDPAREKKFQREEESRLFRNDKSPIPFYQFQFRFGK